MENNLKISVIIVTYKRNNLLPRAMESVLKQSYKDFELLIIDNNEKESAEKIVGKFNDKRIRYLKTEKNLDCSGGKNFGIKKSKGEFIAFLDDDDYWLLKKLEIQMKEFSKYPKAGFCFTAVKNIYDDREHIAEVPNGYDDYYERALRRYNGFLSGTLVIKREVINTVGMLDESFPSHTDIEHIIRITKKYKGIAINQPLLVMRMTSNHVQMGSSLKRKIKGREMILAKNKKAYQTRPKEFALVNFRLGLFYRDDGNFKIAKLKFKECLKKDFKLLYIKHYLSMIGNAFVYKNIWKMRLKI